LFPMMMGRRPLMGLFLLCVVATSKLTPRPSPLKKTTTTATTKAVSRRGGGRQAAGSSSSFGSTPSSSSSPTYAWAVLHNWCYFLSLGLCIPVLPRVIASIVNEDGSTIVSARSSRVGGDVEGLDKLLTFLGVGALGALSDVVGRKALIATSALGYAVTVVLQASAKKKSIGWLFLADAIDGATSCMNPVCSAYVVDVVRDPSRRAIAVGVFQGLSVAGAFVVGYPLSGVLSAKNTKPRRPMFVAAAIQLLNAAIALFVTPESLPPANRRRLTTTAAGAPRLLALVATLFKEGNPFAALKRLFASSSSLTLTATPPSSPDGKEKKKQQQRKGETNLLNDDRRRGRILRFAAIAYTFAWIANLALNTTFVNYVNKVFGWGPKQAGPLLVVVGLLLAVVPRAVVPRLGIKKSIQYGALVFAAGYASIGAVAKESAPLFFAAIVLCGFGATAIPALVATVAQQAPDSDRGAVLGALGTLSELCGAISYPLYGRVFAAALRRPDKLPVATPFYLASAFLVATFLVANRADLGGTNNTHASSGGVGKPASL